ncbi:hypothetical protein [Paracoccus lutimaris]|uniref:Uncharacterized protein n=1 Tax=Paracoccus lutimaris TaxID=1490030 RepID=A0A368Z427_9RHOB|nr:hypothetical protein [Paracoccus lutimaris]RCW87171.1 hypothetical protein DFP89_103175 [Paracoccus lutimaris]
MSQPEPDPKEHRRAQIRESVARHKERLRQMTALERLAYKHRASLGENCDPYTRPEWQQAEVLRVRLEDLIRDAGALHDEILGRLKRDGVDDPGLALLAAALATEAESRFSLKPF